MSDDQGRSRLHMAYLRAIQAVGRHLDYGTAVYEDDWDLLVVLDACRADLMERVAPDVAWLPPPARTRSVGSCSSEWLTRTFSAGRAAAVAETVLVTGNTWTDRYLDADAFAAVDEVWKYAWDDTQGTVPARAITDRGIVAARERDPERLVLHYMQPHHPFLPDPVAGDGGMARTGAHSSGANPWVALRRGELSVERVWAAYEANLRYVLEAVAVAVENIDAERVVITADHGNLFGDWGLYGHPMNVPHPALVTVPWVETAAEDRGTRTPSLAPPEPLPVGRVYGDGSVDDRLESLGYV